MSYAYTSQREVRAAFWQDFDGVNGITSKQWTNAHDGTGRQYNATTRCAFCDYVDMLARDGLISERLAQRVTL